MSFSFFILNFIFLLDLFQQQKSYEKEWKS